MPDTLIDNGHRHLVDKAAMDAALDELTDVTKFPAGMYRGKVEVWWNDDGSRVETLEIGQEGVHTAVVNKAVIGDHLVMPYGRLLHLTDAQYQAAQ